MSASVRLPAGRPAAPPSTGLTSDMTVMIHRMIAGYAVLGLAPAVTQVGAQARYEALWWSAPVLVLAALVVGGMLAAAVRARPLHRWAGAFALLMLLAVLTLAPAVTAAPPVWQPWLWWEVGLATVCAGVWGGLRAMVGYGVVLGVAWALLRTSATGGADLRVALTESVFGVSAGLVVSVVATGMLASAAAADAQAGRLYERQLQDAVARASAQERARLDRLIHDDVMTTLTSAAAAGDADTGRATARLARETLATVDALPTGGGHDGSLSLAVLGTLAASTAHRVSPDVGYVEHVETGAAASRLPMEVAEAVLGALREAVRNAVRHAQADRVEVEVGALRRDGRLQLRVRVVDDGRGFDPQAVLATRLGVRVSMREASARAGVGSDLVSAPGEGTTFTLTWSGPVEAVPVALPRPVAADDDQLPVAFPVRQFSVAVWIGVAVGVVTGLVGLPRLTDLPVVAGAMVAVALAVALALRPGGGLRLGRGPAAAGVALLALGSGLMDLSLRHGVTPSSVVWHVYPTQLLLVVLVVRRRPGHAVLGLVVVEAAFGWWCLRSGHGLGGLVTVGFGHVVFVLMAVLVTRVLRTISRRQAALRREEDVAIDESARRHVARVQRSLWVADLKAQARGALVRLAAVDGPVPAPLRYDALMVEATLRESLVARNVMSDELAELTEGARRRGVDVRFVDSRHTVVPQLVSSGLLDAVRRALGPPSVRRLVVRLAPEDGRAPATVLTEDAAGTHLVILDRDGVGEAQEVQARER